MFYCTFNLYLKIYTTNIKLKQREHIAQSVDYYCLDKPFYPFHSTIFFFNFHNPTIHLIPFYFFSTNFSTFQIPKNIFKSQPFIPLRNSQSQTILHHFFKSFQTIFKLFFLSKKQNEMGKINASKRLVTMILFYNSPL